MYICESWTLSHTVTMHHTVESTHRRLLRLDSAATQVVELLSVLQLAGLCDAGLLPLAIVTVFSGV